MTDPLASFPAFTDAVRARLEAGRAVYGDRSFTRDPDHLLEELAQEALDLAGWGFVLFERIRKQRDALQPAAAHRRALLLVARPVVMAAQPSRAAVADGFRCTPVFMGGTEPGEPITLACVPRVGELVRLGRGVDCADYIVRGVRHIPLGAGGAEVADLFVEPVRTVADGALALQAAAAQQGAERPIS